jgi:Domain of unknown function (DUF6456)
VGAKRRRRGGSLADGRLLPTPERLAHNPVEILERPIRDAYGLIARPLRTIDILAAMRRRGAITDAMHQAGQTFRAAFRRAALDPLRAQDLLRAIGADADGVPFQVEAARRHVRGALAAAGGVHSAGGACLWHVLGAEESLKNWALQQGWSGRRVSQEAASGILIGALGALAQHYHLTGGGARR